MVDLGGVQEDVVLEIVLQSLRHLVISGNAHALCPEILLHLLRHFPPVDEERRLLCVYEQVGDEHGVAVNVAAAQVQRPRDVVECSREHTVGMLTPQRAPYLLNLLPRALAGKLRRLYPHRRRWYRRAVSPYRAQRVEVGAQRHPAFTPQLAGELLHHRLRHHHAVDAHLGGAPRSLPGELLPKPLRYRRRASHAFLHQHELRAAQLFRRRDEIAAVRPQRRRVHSHHRRACRPVEAAYPLAPLPVVCHILAVVRVCAREDESAQSLAPHHLAQRVDSLVYCLFHILSYFTCVQLLLQI